MGLLNKVKKYFSKSEPKSLPELHLNGADEETIPSGAKVAAIAAALHHHAHQSTDVRARVAAIAAALHHHEQEHSVQNNGLAGLASLVAAIHHHNNKK